MPPYVPLPAAALQFLAAHPGSVLLESALPAPGFGRYSLVGMHPETVMESRGPVVTIRTGDDIRELRADPFSVLNDMLTDRSAEPGAGLPAGAAVGYLGYDLKDRIEKLPALATDDLQVPDCRLGFYDTLLAFDHTTGIATATGPGPEPGWVRELNPLLAAADDAGASAPVTTGPVSSTFTRDAYLAAVRRIKEYISAGDIYQANLAQRFSTPFTDAPIDLYRNLRRTNPAPFAAYLGYDDFQVLSSSPERFLRMEGTSVETRPIKGTRPRSADPAEDARLQQELLASTKDRAELLMITDLLRNDLGRVCAYGTVHVPELQTLETYATVHHLVSTIRGTLRSGCTHTDALRAAFPGGSITGAPKIRAMEIIEELEPVKRGVYTGAVGYLGYNGVSDFNIAIRTMTLKDGTVHFHAGGGIVADSDPAAEYDETLHKAEGMFRALGTDTAAFGRNP